MAGIAYVNDSISTTPDAHRRARLLRRAAAWRCCRRPLSPAGGRSSPRRCATQAPAAVIHLWVKMGRGSTRRWHRLRSICGLPPGAPRPEQPGRTPSGRPGPTSATKVSVLLSPGHRALVPIGSHVARGRHFAELAVRPGTTGSAPSRIGIASFTRRGQARGRLARHPR